MIPLHRRQFTQFLGASAVVAIGQRVMPGWLVSLGATTDTAPLATPFFDGLPLQTIAPAQADEITLAEGLGYQVLLKQGDIINPRGQRYGDHNDYLAHLQTSPDDGWLWINHEKASLNFIADDWSRFSTQAQAAAVLENMGGSCLRIRRNPAGQWRPVIPERRNFRVDGLNTRFRLTGPARGSEWVSGTKEAIGTVGNCGGGISPWGTFFSAEENFQNYFADPEMPEIEIESQYLKAAQDAEAATFEQPMLVQAFYPRPTNHYGYMIEVDPQTGQCWKHTSLGRFSHENIAFAVTRDRRLACYLGDDRMGQCIYKFISRDRFEPRAGKANRRLLENGMLYVADTERGRWLALDSRSQPALRKAGFDPARVCVHTRTAASLVGGTPLARPEDVEVHPLTGDVFVCITAYQAGQPAKGAAYTSELKGALARIQEAGGDAGALEFEFGIFVAGTLETGLAWPDSVGFGANGDLIVTSDYKPASTPVPHSAQSMFGNNFLMLVPVTGGRAGQVTRFAACPPLAEFCSPTLSPDRGELWVNVQHPGEGAKSRATLTSHWPDGGQNLPRSCMIAIQRRQ